MPSFGPHPERDVVMADAALARRVRAFADRVGRREAQRFLRIGEATFDAAAEEGRLLRSTRDRLVAALDREGNQASFNGGNDAST